MRDKVFAVFTVTSALFITMALVTSAPAESKKKLSWEQLLGKPKKSESTKKEGTKEEEEEPSTLDKALGILGAGVKVTKASQSMSRADEEKLGRGIAVEVFKRYGKISPNKKLRRYVSLVGKTVAESAKDKRKYRFAVIKNKAVNAFAAPGGYIFVTTGLLKSLTNEAQLAGVLAHEVTHVSLEHMLKAVQRTRKFSGAAKVSAILSGDDPEKFNQIVKEATDILFTSGLGKKEEFEADKWGVAHAVGRGYHPEGLVAFLETLNRNRKDGKSVFFSTHPPTRERIKRLKREVLPKHKRYGQQLTGRFNANKSR